MRYDVKLHSTAEQIVEKLRKRGFYGSSREAVIRGMVTTEVLKVAAHERLGFESGSLDDLIRQAKSKGFYGTSDAAVIRGFVTRWIESNYGILGRLTGPAGDARQP